MEPFSVEMQQLLIWWFFVLMIAGVFVTGYFLVFSGVALWNVAHNPYNKEDIPLGIGISVFFVLLCGLFVHFAVQFTPWVYPGIVIMPRISAWILEILLFLGFVVCCFVGFCSIEAEIETRKRPSPRNSGKKENTLFAIGGGLIVIGLLFFAQLFPMAPWQ